MEHHCTHCKTKNSNKTNSCCKPQPSGCGQCGKTNMLNNNIKDIILISISAIFMILGLIDLYHLTNIKFFYYFNFSYLTIIISGIPIYYFALKSLFKGKITSNLLVSLAITASIILEILRLCGIQADGGHSSFAVAAAEIAILMSIGSFIESFIVSKSKSGLKRLISLSPKIANVKKGNSFETKKLEDVKIGDIVLIKPDEKISVDGVVISGSTSVDMSNITGEYALKSITKGDEVYGGTWNKEGAIEVQVTKAVQDMTMQKLIKLTMEAEGKKAPIARIADKWAGFIVPTAIVCSILVFLISKFAFGISYLDAFLRSVTVLVVFCPCALALATPTAIAAGIGNGTKKGILIKSGSALEALSKASIVCIDKTGTLTTGTIKLEKIVSDIMPHEELLFYAASAELLSNHPIAKAIVSYAKQKEIKLIKPDKVESKTGVGIEAKIKDKKVKVLTMSKVSETKDNKQLEEEGYTVIAVIINDILSGYFCLSDTIKPGAKEMISAIKAKNIKIVMLTGDNSYSAKLIASECGIDEVYSNLMPEDKQLIIKNFEASGKKVCMIGDGVNDAPSLALASCSIAIGALSSDIAMEAADISIMNDSLNSIKRTINLSKIVVQTIIRNIIISMSINFIAVILSLFGLLNPVTGALIHQISSLFVVISSALLLLYDVKKNKKRA